MFSKVITGDETFYCGFDHKTKQLSKPCTPGENHLLGLIQPEECNPQSVHSFFVSWRQS